MGKLTWPSFNKGDKFTSDMANNLKIAVNDNDDNTKFQSQLPDGVRTSKSFGNIPAGTDVATLKGNKLNALIEQALFERELPTYTNPSLSVSWNQGGIKFERGTTLSNIIATASLNAGQILNGNGSVFGDMAVDPFDYAFTGAVVENFPAEMVKTIQSSPIPSLKLTSNGFIRCDVDYNSNPNNPQDSYGDEYDLNLNPGSVNDTLNYSVYLKYFAGSAVAKGDLPADGSEARSTSSNSGEDRGTTFQLNVGGKQTAWVAVPSGRSIRVMDNNGIPLNITDSFESESFTLQDAGGDSYPGTLYNLKLDAPYPTGTYNLDVTLL
jgi:hypothetical protein